MNEYSQTTVVTHSNPAAAIVMFVVYVAIYIYIAYALYTMAKKTNTANAWMAWIPILDVYLMVKIAGKPGWWFILLLVPLLNVVIAIMLWYYIAERMGKPGWVGVLMIIPLVNLVIPGYLAFSKSPAPAAMPPAAV